MREMHHSEHPITVSSQETHSTLSEVIEEKPNNEIELSPEAREIIETSKKQRFEILLKHALDLLKPWVNKIPVIGDEKMLREAITGNEGNKKLSNAGRIARLVAVSTAAAAIYLFYEGYDFSGLAKEISDPSFDYNHFFHTVADHTSAELAISGALEGASSLTTFIVSGHSFGEKLIPILKSIQPKLANLISSINISQNNS